MSLVFVAPVFLVDHQQLHFLQFLSPSIFDGQRMTEKADIPVSCDAASAFTVCSIIISTGFLEKDLADLLIGRPPFSSTYHTPGCESSIFIRFSK